MTRLWLTALATVLALAAAGCGDEEEPPSAKLEDTTLGAGVTGQNAPRVLNAGHGREVSRAELEEPLEERLARVSCPAGVNLGSGLRFSCQYSDPRLGTGPIDVRQVSTGRSPRFRWETFPRASRQLSGSFALEP